VDVRHPLIKEIRLRKIMREYAKNQRAAEGNKVELSSRNWHREETCSEDLLTKGGRKQKRGFRGYCRRSTKFVVHNRELAYLGRRDKSTVLPSTPKKPNITQCSGPGRIAVKRSHGQVVVTLHFGNKDEANRRTGRALAKFDN